MNSIIPYLSERELKKVIATAITYITTMSYDKMTAILYFFYYTGIDKQAILKITRKEIKESKRQNKFFYSKKVQMVLNQYFRSEPEQNNAFNLTERTLRTLFENIKRYSNIRAEVNVFKRSYEVNKERRNQW